MSEPSMENLPIEVLYTILNELPTKDRKNLSLANSALRNATAPYLFKVLQANCPLPEHHVGEAVVRKYGPYVLELRLNVIFFPNKMEGEGEGEGDSGSDSNNASEPEGIIEVFEEEEPGAVSRDDHDEAKWYWTNPPASVWARKAADIAVIHGLIQFKGLPCCKSLTLHTDGDKEFEVDGEWDDNDIGFNSIYFCCEPEDWEEINKKEQKYLWRRALRDLYQDVATMSPVEELKILNFLPRKVSYWQRQEWAIFLGRLKKLVLYPYGGNNGAGWNANTLPGFNNFFSELSNFMLTHAKELEYLEIVAHEWGFLGSDSLVLAPEAMPALRVLHLGNVAVTSILPKFLQGTHKSLNRLHITKCVALGCDSEGADQPTWADLWKLVRKVVADPAEITCVLPKTLPLTAQEAYGDDYYKPTESELREIRRLKRMVANEKDFYIWPYAGVDEKYGDVLPDEEKNLGRLSSEEDNLEYRLLVEKVQNGGGRCNVVLS